MKAFAEVSYRIFDGVEPSYHVEVSDDTDGIDMVEISYWESGKRKESVRFNKDQAELVCEAIRKVAERLPK